jgi:hypothetical protein
MVNNRFGHQRYHRSMSEHPPSGPSAAHGSSGYPAAPTGFPRAPVGSHTWPSPSGAPSRWPTFLALALAVIASGLAIAGWFRPAPTAPPPHSTGSTFTDEQISDARGHACTAFELVNKGVGLETNGQLGSDPAMQLAQGTNARLTTISSGWYLKARLEPAAPTDLAAAIRHLSDVLLDLGANYLAAAKDDQPSQAALRSEGNAAFDRVTELCK